MMAKLHELNFALRPHPPYTPGLDCDYWLFADLKRMHQDSNKGGTAETGANFETKYKSVYTAGVVKLEKLCNDYIILVFWK